MSMGLTERQARVLAYLKRYSAARGVMPSLDEITLEMGVASKSRAHEVLKALEDRGHIRRIPCKSRAIEVIERPDFAHLNDAALTGLVLCGVRELKRRGVALSGQLESAR